MSVPKTPQAIATHGGTNAAVALIVGAYLAIALYQGQLGALADAARDDFLGTNGQKPFWRWAAALLILIALAQSPKLNFLFGPMVVFALVAMMIQTAQTQGLATLNAGIASFFGKTAAASPTSTGNVPAIPGLPALPTQ